MEAMKRLVCPLCTRGMRGSGVQKYLIRFHYRANYDNALSSTLRPLHSTSTECTLFRLWTYATAPDRVLIAPVLIFSHDLMDTHHLGSAFLRHCCLNEVL
jgi:hypothetical protein